MGQVFIASACVHPALSCYRVFLGDCGVARPGQGPHVLLGDTEESSRSFWRDQTGQSTSRTCQECVSLVSACFVPCVACVCVCLRQELQEGQLVVSPRVATAGNSSATGSGGKRRGRRKHWLVLCSVCLWLFKSHISWQVNNTLSYQILIIPKSVRVPEKTALRKSEMESSNFAFHYD